MVFSYYFDFGRFLVINGHYCSPHFRKTLSAILISSGRTSFTVFLNATHSLTILLHNLRSILKMQDPILFITIESLFFVSALVYSVQFHVNGVDLNGGIRRVQMNVSIFGRQFIFVLR